MGDIDARQFHQLADLSRKYAGGRARITHQQNIAFRWVPEGALYEVWQCLCEIGFGDAGAHEITDIVSCPGTDSCKLGITSSMGLGRALTDAVEEVDKSDPLVRGMRIKMSGCPNGCGQHHIADIGFHGAAAKGPGGQVPAYELFLGGSYAQDDARFGQRVRTKIPAKRAPDALKSVIADYRPRAQRRRTLQGLCAARRHGTLRRDALRVQRPARPEPRDAGAVHRLGQDSQVALERGEGECAV